MKELYQSLKSRKRPEEVAILISKTIPLKTDEKKLIDTISRIGYGYSSMSDEFYTPVGIEKLLNTSAELFRLDLPNDTFNLSSIEDFVQRAEKNIAIKPGKVDFKYDRLNRKQRKAAGLDISRRQYNKLFRTALRLEEKVKTFGMELEKAEFGRIAKSRFAYQISEEDFNRDPNSAAFIAYYTSKCNLRSVFTNTKQDRPFDEICEMLLQKCYDNPKNANWYAIAYVFPDVKVLNYLSDKQKMDLLVKWYDVLTRLSKLLEETWNRSNINRKTMIVKKGNDSSTWNSMAGAWNKARDAWISLLYGLGMEKMLDEFCIGKVLRLMAADVAWWHSHTGGELEPDTAVWNEIPLPWEVLNGNKKCTKEYVLAICNKFNVDPVSKGWVAPKKYDNVQPFKPTPELVHGVIVGHPLLALYLKNMGFFSGK